jgi:TetR/AcrR family transcriptional repressor of nem operon
MMFVINVVKGPFRTYVFPMRLTKDQAAKNRREILETAERLFRERGFDGVGVADLMKEAGFTHGGFYNHFGSKEELAAETCAVSFERAAEELAEKLASGRARAWRELVTGYLSPEHRDDPSTGCTASALAADVARQGAEVQASFANGLERLIELVAAREMAAEPELGKAAARERAIQTWCELVGAVVLSRSVARAGPELSEEILDAARRRVLRGG